MKPQRIVLSRKKGWRKPENTVVVARPGEWGNPFIVSPHARPGSRSGACYICMPTVEEAVECHRLMWEVIAKEQPERFAYMQTELRGKHLACWCREGPCHADTLLQIANA